MNIHQQHVRERLQEISDSRDERLVLREENRRLRNACRMVHDACGPHENWNGETRAFLKEIEKVLGIET